MCIIGSRLQNTLRNTVHVPSTSSLFSLSSSSFSSSSSSSSSPSFVLFLLLVSSVFSFKFLFITDISQRVQTDTCLACRPSMGQEVSREDFDTCHSPPLAEKSPTADWMGQLLGDTQSVAELSLPGTHCSCVQHGGGLYQCQTWSLTAQADSWHTVSGHPLSPLQRQLYHLLWQGLPIQDIWWGYPGGLGFSSDASNGVCSDESEGGRCWRRHYTHVRTYVLGEVLQKAL